MKKDKIFLFLFIVPLFFSTSFLKKTIAVEDKGRHVSAAFRSNSHSANSVSLSEYEVRFIYTGFTSFHGDASVCPVRTNGTVVLAGLLKGIENVSADDDISYEGTLQLDMDIDICSVKGEGGNAKMCNITVTGSGPVKTELVIYYDGRGGYIQIKDTTSRGFRKNAAGTCDLAEIAEERLMIPLKTIATIFNGLELPMLTQRTLRKGPPQIIRTAEGELLVEVLRKVR